MPYIELEHPEPHVRENRHVSSYGKERKKGGGNISLLFPKGKRNPLILLVCRRNINDRHEEYAC